MTRAAIGVAGATLLCLLVLVGSVHASTAPPYMAVSPTKAPVGDKIIVSGQGFPSNTDLVLYWSTANVTWAVGGTPVPQVNGVNTVPFQIVLANTRTNGSGYFSQTVVVPVDNNGQHIIQAVGPGSSSPLAEATFTLEPEFSFSPASGPAGTPITVFATGLGARLYAAEYHVLWDNNYMGYMTGVTTHGQANFTFYATGAPGVHYITIYNGYPGPAFLNSQQAPESVQITSYDPPLIPFHGQFTITSPTQPTQGSEAAGVLSILGLGTTFTALGAALVLGVRPSVRKGTGKLSVIIIAAALVLGGSATLFAYAPSTPGTAAAQTNAGYTPQAVVIRPVTTIPASNDTTGPRITVTPDVATVGTVVNVTGLGFTPGAQVPLTWTTHVGSHVTGFSSSVRSLRNVTANAAGSFSFTMKVPADLEGIHNIIAPNLPPQGNGTLYIERVASISATQGPAGSKIVISLMGTGWDYQDNIVAVDYDNSYIGYGCGFNENGNITITLTAYGAPGYHSIDLYPSIYLGPPAGSTIAIFRYPILTPYDGPEGIPAFHFSFLITQGTSQPQGIGGNLSTSSGSHSP